MTESGSTAPQRALRMRTTVAVTEASRSYVAAFYAYYPHRGTWAGWHANDGAIYDASPASQAARLADLDAWGPRLRDLEIRTDARRAAGAIATDTHEADRRELAILEYARNDELFRLRRWRLAQSDPRSYYSALDVSVYVTRMFAPPRERLHALTMYLRGVPQLLATAHEQFDRALGRRRLTTAIVTYRRLASYYRSDLAQAGLVLAATEGEREDFRAALDAAASALERFTLDLEARLPAADENFRRGADWVLEYLAATELLTFTLDELRALGREALVRHQELAESVAQGAGASLALALRQLDENPLVPGNVLLAARQTAGDLAALFASGAVVAPLPHENDCEVRAMPPHLPAGTALFEGPGVFDAPGMPAILYLSLPQPAALPPVRRMQMARVSPWALRNTVAHEVVPGHHLHWTHMARARSLAARAFPSLANIEGWAHYAEELALTYGDRVDPRYPLAALRMGLLRNCRFLMALELHAGTASEEDAARFIAQWTGFSPQRSAEEALRGVLDPGYLVYTLGRVLLQRLRDEYAARHGARYGLRRFHDAFFAQGGVPLPLVRRALLGESVQEG